MTPNKSPLDVALAEISETRRILQAVITSSETFDYPQARLALKELTKKMKELARLQARLEAKSKGSLGSNVQRVDFSGESARGSVGEKL